MIALGVILVTAPLAAAGLDELPPHIIAIEGRALPALVGRPIDCLRATALTAGGEARPVPIQSDERFVNDGVLVWAFEHGEDPRPDPDSSLDGDDLVLVDGRDSGACDPLPPDVVRLEIEGFGCLLIGCDASATRAAPRVRTDGGGGAIVGDGYRLGFAPEGAAWLNELRLGGEEAENLLDRSKARLRLELPLGLVVQRDEGDVRTRVTGEHRGPLRVVREIEVRGRVTFNLYSAPIRDRFVFYADGFSIPTSVVISPSAAFLLRSIALRLSMDLRPAAGLEFASAPDATTAVPITGHGGERASAAPLEWYLIRSGDVGLLGWLETDPVYRDGVTLYYRDDDNHLDPPEDVPGEHGDHGFAFSYAGDLHTGGFRLMTQAWIVRGRSLADPAAMRRTFYTRPTYRVH